MNVTINIRIVAGLYKAYNKEKEGVIMEEKEKISWLRKIRLAKYASLKLKENKSEDEQTLMKAIENTLFDMGVNARAITNYINNFIQGNLEEKMATKCNEIFDDILKKMETTRKEVIDTKSFPEYYFKIQEVIAMDSDMAKHFLKEAEERVNVEHVLITSTDMEGNDRGGHTYYFSKK